MVVRPKLVVRFVLEPVSRTMSLALSRERLFSFLVYRRRGLGLALRTDPLSHRN
jgi:hypothetical protein